MNRSSILILIALATGCSKTSAGDDPGASKSVEAASGTEAKAGLIAKINAYVSCLNSMNPPIRDSRKRYYGWAPPQKGPTMDGAGQGISAVTRETTYGYQCFKNRDAGLDDIGKLPPVPGLDEAGAAYQKALNEVMAAMSAAAEYYNHKDYKDDKLVKGKEHHAILVEKFTQFEHATHGLEAAMQVIQDKLGADRIAELEKTEGKKARWHQSKLMRAADLLVRVASEGAQPDVAKLTEAGEAYAKIFAETKAWTDANKAEADKESSWGSFVREADETLTAWKEMARVLRDKKKLPDSGDGSVDELITEYNSLVGTSNGLWD